MAGSEAFARVSPAWRTDLAARFTSDLQRHVKDAWYPVSVDRELGGFRTDLDRRWRPVGPDDRMLEYQARHTRTVARLGRAFPLEPQWADYATHGVRYLTDVMRDGESGGWFWLVDRHGAPQASATKHAHSTAYVISALVEAYRLTGDSATLDLAVETFEWLERALHDNEHGGYHGWATRDGRPILDRAQVPDWPYTTDPLGHQIGLKDINVHSDLTDSLRLLCAERPNAVLQERARELYDIIDVHFTAADDAMHYLLRPDLTPVDGPERPGYALQLAYRLPQLASYLGRSTEEAIGHARRRVDRALASGWMHGNNGVVDELVKGRPSSRSWWVQTEALQALLLLEVNFQYCRIRRHGRSDGLVHRARNAG